MTFVSLSIIGVFQPESVRSDAIVAWVDFWTRTYSSATSDSVVTEEVLPGALISASVWQLLTPKQLLLLAQSTSSRESWNHVTTLLIQLMKSGLVRYKDVQEQAVAVVRQEWPQVYQLSTITIGISPHPDHDVVVMSLCGIYRNCWRGLRPACVTLSTGTANTIQSRIKTSHQRMLTMMTNFSVGYHGFAPRKTCN